MLKEKSKNKVTKLKDKICCNVYETYNYDKFELIGWNRYIDPKHVKTLKESFEKEAFLRPISVRKNKNEKLLILDGQHTFKARKELEKPILYIIEPSKTKNNEIILSLNTHSKKWTLYDYMTAHANTGNREYIQAIAFMEEFREFRYFKMFISLLRNTHYNSSKELKNGLFKIIDFEKSKKNAKLLLELRHLRGFTINKLDLCKNKKLFLSMFALIKLEKFDKNRFIKKCENFPTLIYPCIDINSYKNMLIHLYNYNQAEKTKLFFD